MGTAPVPLKACTVGEFEALLAKLALAEAPPEACGANVTVNDALLPAEIVTGNMIPLTENSEPLRPPSEETVTAPVLAFSLAA